MTTFMNKWVVKRKVRKGERPAFTLLEMSIVIFIIALLILIIVPNISNQKKHATSVHSEALKTVVQTQTELYLEDHEDDGKVKVTFAMLEGGGYLTPNQVKKAEKTLKINGNHVESIGADNS